MSNPVSSSSSSRPRRFLGWPMVGLAFLLYGLGMAPAYYAWGFLAPEIIADVGLNREQIGNTFGLFALTFAATSPLAAAAIARIGLRSVIALGAAIGAAGFAWTSVADDPRELLLAYALTGGIGIGLCTLVPVQTLAVEWFERRRARATGLILLGAGVVGAFVPSTADALLVTHDWRFVFRVVAVLLLSVGASTALLLRARPAEMGQYPDGLEPQPQSVSQNQVRPDTDSLPSHAPPLKRMLFTPAFLFLTIACLANTVPWRVVTAHGRLHLEDLGFASSVVAAILGLRVGLSGIGRIAGALGDVIDPRRVLSASLLTTAVGMTLFASSRSALTAYLAIALLGLAYGLGMTSEPVCVARIFGRDAFLSTNGLRIAITGVAGWLAPRWAGAAADATGSYQRSFFALAALCLFGAGMALLTRPSRPDPKNGPSDLA